ncbi:pectate lyase-like [Argentina anserina]|uniref:pectate lyase-like n=1 Tax=Argentina anserina TaxID=57926 RepID=UPI0021764AAE|nr:pectate lyase-like [Potentilla anserina]
MTIWTMAITTPGGSIFLVFLFFSSVAVFVSGQNYTAEEDEYWKQRAASAIKVAKESVHPDPHNVTEEFNAAVHKHIMGHNRTRRTLRGFKRYDGVCNATNPIDACWRCDPDWAENRQKMADCVMGFGKKTTGGKGGPIYVVTDGSDDDLVNPKEGTLRYAVTRKGPLWITFAHSMVIRLQQELLVTCDKTIDGRGFNIVFAYGGGITLQYVSNIIITNIHVKDIESKAGGTLMDSEDHVGLRTRSDGDGISLFGASNIWIDHVSMARTDDGLIDAIMLSTGVTISNSHFTDHNEAMLFGASNSHTQDKDMQITLAFNHFGQGLIQRMPRCRFGFFHVVNNDYTHWIMYAIGGNMNPTIISQGNRFIAPESQVSKEVTKREYSDPSEWKNWNWRSEGDVMENGAFFTESGDPNYAKSSKIAMMPFRPGSLAPSMSSFAGALECCVGQPC